MEKFNNLTFIKFSEPKIRSNGIKRVRAFFKCKCNEIKEYDYSSVKCGHTKQCNKCAHKQRSINRSTHNLVKHPLYRKWQDMKNRCYNPKVHRYHCYGALGIKVCEEWKNDFKSFHDWAIENNWEEGLSIERINVNGNYEPGNCTLIELPEQRFNKRNTFYVQFKGEKISLAKLLYINNLSHKYKNIWFGISRSNKSIEYYAEKYNLK